MTDKIEKLAISCLMTAIDPFRNRCMRVMSSAADAASTGIEDLGAWLKRLNLTGAAPYSSLAGSDKASESTMRAYRRIVDEALATAESSVPVLSTAEETGSTPGIGALPGFFCRITGNIPQPKLYHTAASIGDDLPIPAAEPPRDLQETLSELWAGFEAELSFIRGCPSVSGILMLLEKYFSFAPAVAGNGSLFHSSVFQHAKLAAALAANLLQAENENGAEPEVDAKLHLLISGDLSGIQDFLYTIASEGALKILRGRSFYLEMLTEHVVQALIQKTGGTRANVLHTGGGGFAMLAANTAGILSVIGEMREEINQWLLETFEGRLHYSLAAEPFPKQELWFSATGTHGETASALWKRAGRGIDAEKRRKFSGMLDKLLEPRMPHLLDEHCPICLSDDKELDGRVKAMKTCKTCSGIGKIADRLQKPEQFGFVQVCDPKEKEPDFEIAGTGYVFVREKQADMPTFVINSWDAADWAAGDCVQVLVGNYRSGFDTLESIVEATPKGRRLVGALRMDVDDLGRIFADAGEEGGLVRVSSMSRALNLFFKYYLHSICAGRTVDSHRTGARAVGKRRIVDVIYSGGDDLFVLGSWSEAAELAFDIRQAFERFTGEGTGMTLSAGLTLHKAKFPVYQMARMSKQAENEAKGNTNASGDRQKDSISLFFNESWRRTDRQCRDTFRKYIRKGWEEGPVPHQVVSTAAFWDKAENEIFKVVQSLEKNVDWEKVPHGFIRKLFGVAAAWQRDGKFYLPLLNRITKDSAAALGAESVRLLNGFSDSHMMEILVVLTWLENLRRTEDQT